MSPPPYPCLNRCGLILDCESAEPEANKSCCPQSSAWVFSCSNASLTLTGYLGLPALAECHCGGCQAHTEQPVSVHLVGRGTWPQCLVGMTISDQDTDAHSNSESYLSVSSHAQHLSLSLVSFEAPCSEWSVQPSISTLSSTLPTQSAHTECHFILFPPHTLTWVAGVGFKLTRTNMQCSLDWDCEHLEWSFPVAVGLCTSTFPFP